MGPSAPPPRALVGRMPQVDPERLITDLVPPPRFDAVRFETYVTDPAQPTQAAAIAGLRAFADGMAAGVPRRSWFRRAPSPPEGRPGVYLDGGFGVGKTHLLASLWQVAPEPKVYGTFVEFTNFVGALSFNRAGEVLASCRLVCIDEFELDDPGDTVLMSSLLTGLADRGVRLAATSNTLPDSLGEGRFAAADFLREIQALAGKFDVIRVDGPDYRHRQVLGAPPAVSDAELARAAERQGATLDDFGDLLDHLAVLHPSRYGALLDSVSAVCLRDIRMVHDQAVALRLVVFIDRLYDREIPFYGSGAAVDAVFSPEMLRGGYRKKYLRAMSRLIALAGA